MEGEGIGAPALLPSTPPIFLPCFHLANLKPDFYFPAFYINYRKTFGEKMSTGKFIPLNSYKEFPVSEMLSRSKIFFEEMNKRRTVRTFSDKSFPREIIDNCILTASSAPSGANMQPWHFVIVSDPKIKKEIRDGAEKEEREFYSGKAPAEWLKALEPLGTDSDKPFLERAPYIIVIFEKKFDEDGDGNKIKHYYTKESVGIATGILITAIQNAGLASLTHTPRPMNFLNNILKRPENEKPFLILVVGYPEQNSTVPDINRKSLDKVASFL